MEIKFKYELLKIKNNEITDIKEFNSQSDLLRMAKYNAWVSYMQDNVEKNFKNTKKNIKKWAEENFDNEKYQKGKFYYVPTPIIFGIGDLAIRFYIKK